MRVLIKVVFVATAVVGLIVAAVVGVGFFLSPQDNLYKADVIVAISGGETSQRTAEAVRLYQEGYAPQLLFSGAAADRSGPSNAAAMRADALRQGVPKSAIIIEEGSNTTAENAADVAPLLKRLDARTIILVTSPYHQRRASLNFHQMLGSGVTIINHSSADSAWRKSSWWRTPYALGLTLAELQKILYAWSTQPKGRG